MDDLEGVHELYALDPSEFTAARDALVRALRAGGDRQGASAVAALRKPPRSAWGLNRIARDRPEVVGRVHDAAGAVQAALDSGDGAALRAAQAEHLAAVEAAVDAAAAQGVEGDAMRTRMRNTVLAAGADPQVAEVWARGELAVDHDAPGFVLAPGPAAGRQRPDSDDGSSAPATRRVRRVGGRRSRASSTSAEPHGRTNSEQAAPGQAALEQAALEQAALEQAALEQAALEQAALDDAAAAAEAERVAQLQRARLRARRQLDRRIERLQATVDRTAAAAEEQQRRADEARRAAADAAAELARARRERAELDDPPGE